MQKIEKWDETNGRDRTAERLEAFLSDEQNAYAILQLKRDAPVQERYASYASLQRRGLEPDLLHYDVLYEAALPASSNGTPTDALLEELFQQFNLYRPEDFSGRSMSVSDIMALRQAGVVSCHYVDSIGFKELPGFLKPENHLKNAEMALEDDYGMIDGVINNGKSAAAEERASVLERLRQEPCPSEKASKPCRRQEKELD